GPRRGRPAGWGGLLVELPGGGASRKALRAGRGAGVVGIAARLAEIDDLLHSRSRHMPRCECGAPILRGSHFCPNCGRTLDPKAEPDVSSEETVLASEE